MKTNSNVTGFEQLLNASALYINGAVISNDATTPNTVINVSSGIMRDQSNTIDINLGDYLVTDTVTVVDSANVGANGMDEGILQASKVYYVYVIADSSTNNPTAAIISLNDAATGPVMPYQYNCYRHIGFVHTDSSVNFISATWLGSANLRSMIYYAPRATTVSAGNATTFTGFSLSPLVPAIKTSATLNLAYTPATAGNEGDVTVYGGANAQLIVTGQVSSVAVTAQGRVAVLLVSNVPAISYKVSNASDSINIKVNAYDFTV